MSRFGIQQIKLNGTYFAGVKGYHIDRGLDVNSDGSDGLVYETGHYLMRRKPVADLTTLSLKAMIVALNGSTDFPMLALDGTNGLAMYLAKQASNSDSFAGGSVHVSRTGLRGLIHATGVRWTPAQKAELSLRAMFLSADGQSDAITESLVALPTQPTPDFAFVLTALTLNGVAIPGVNSLELAIDPKFEFDYSAGLPDPVSIMGAGVNGKLGITLRAEIGECDIGSGTGAVSAVFTQLASGGTLGTATVTFTLQGDWTSESGIGGDNGQPGSRSLLVRTKWDGTNKPLTWATA